MQKKCSRCKVVKDVSEFYISKSTKDGYRCYCKNCQKESCQTEKCKLNRKKRWERVGRKKRKEWLAKNQDRYKSQKKKYVKKTRDFRRLLKKECVDYLGGKCEECGYNKCLSSLDFHHLDSSQKEFSISKQTQKLGSTLDKLKEELDKCKLLCKNCHTFLHIGY